MAVQDAVPLAWVHQASFPAYMRDHSPTYWTTLVASMSLSAKSLRRRVIFGILSRSRLGEGTTVRLQAERVTKRALITRTTGQKGSYIAGPLLDKAYKLHGLVRRSSSFNTGRVCLHEELHERRLFLDYGDLTKGVVAWSANCMRSSCTKFTTASGVAARFYEATNLGVDRRAQASALLTEWSHTVQSASAHTSLRP
jgi:hypothetical protein